MHSIRIEASKITFCCVSVLVQICHPDSENLHKREGRAEEKTEKDASLPAFISPLVIMHVGDA